MRKRHLRLVHSANSVPARVAVAPNDPWPFLLLDRRRYEALNEQQRGYLQGRILQAIEECEAARR